MIQRQKIQNISETKSCFFEKVSKIDKPSTRLIKKKKSEDSNKIRNEKGEVTTDTTEIQRIGRKYYKQFYANKWTTWAKWINPRNIQSFRMESGRI